MDYCFNCGNVTAKVTEKGGYAPFGSSKYFVLCRSCGLKIPVDLNKC